jgi:hypothetical protein
MADNVAELHKIGDAIAMMFVSKEREYKAMLWDEPLIKEHREKAIKKQTYDKIFVKKLGLNLINIREQITGAAFDCQCVLIQLSRSLCKNRGGSIEERSSNRE